MSIAYETSCRPQLDKIRGQPCPSATSRCNQRMNVFRWCVRAGHCHQAPHIIPATAAERKKAKAAYPLRGSMYLGLQFSGQHLLGSNCSTISYQAALQLFGYVTPFLQPGGKCSCIQSARGTDGKVQSHQAGQFAVDAADM